MNSTLKIQSGGAASDDDKLLWRMTTVARKLDISVRTLERWRAKGEFPEPDIKMSDTLLVWKRETVLNWIEQRQAE